MKRLRPFFSRLQWKLAFSYALVAVVIVGILLLAFTLIATTIESRGMDLSYQSLYWSSEGFKRNVPPKLDDPAQLQKWLDRVQREGFTEDDYQYDIPPNSLLLANTLHRKSPIVVLDEDRKVIAVSPRDSRIKTGDDFDPEAVFGTELDSVLVDTINPRYGAINHSRVMQDGSVLVVAEMRDEMQMPAINVDIPSLARENPLPENSALVIYQYKPLRNLITSNLGEYRTYITLLGLMMLCLAVPMGLVLGWWASRGLRKRLVTLSEATQRWRTGDFTPTIQDNALDEVGELTRNLNSMTEQLQTTFQTKDELVRLEERNKLARDLHDTVKQQTYAARMQLSAAKNLLHTDAAAAEEHLDAALQLNKDTQQEVKLIIDELRPPALDGKGLAQALTEYAARWQEQSGIEARVSVVGERNLPLDVEQALYRVVQETLANAARHSEATLVKINLTMDEAKVELAVLDNGIGFDPATVSSSSFGLSGMRQRLASVHGTLLVESILSVGTKITASVPAGG